MSVTDNMSKSLQDAGYAGALSDMLYQWLGTFSDNPDQSISDLWREALINLSGLPEDEYNYNDYYSAYLTSRGYIGAFSDQLDYFWQDIADGVIDLPEGGTPPPPTNTISIGEGIDPTSGGKFVGYVDDPDSGETLGAMTPNDYLGGNWLFFAIAEFDNNGTLLYFPSVQAENNPDFGPITATIDGTAFTLTRDPVLGSYVFDDGNPANSQIYNKAAFEFMEARIGQTVSFDITTTP